MVNATRTNSNQSKDAEDERQGATVDWSQAKICLVTFNAGGERDARDMRDKVLEDCALNGADAVVLAHQETDIQDAVVPHHHKAGAWTLVERCGRRLGIGVYLLSEGKFQHPEEPHRLCTEPTGTKGTVFIHLIDANKRSFIFGSMHASHGSLGTYRPSYQRQDWKNALQHLGAYDAGTTRALLGDWNMRTPPALVANALQSSNGMDNFERLQELYDKIVTDGGGTVSFTGVMDELVAEIGLESPFLQEVHGDALCPSYRKGEATRPETDREKKSRKVLEQSEKDGLGWMAKLSYKGHNKFKQSPNIVCERPGTGAETYFWSKEGREPSWTERIFVTNDLKCGPPKKRPHQLDHDPVYTICELSA
jgi:hypothetical protein